MHVNGTNSISSPVFLISPFFRIQIWTKTRARRTEQRSHYAWLLTCKCNGEVRSPHPRPLNNYVVPVDKKLAPAIV